MTRLLIHSTRIIFAVWLTAAASVAGAEPSSEDHDFFEKEVRPVLVSACGKCHGAKSQKGGLRLDSRQALLEGGVSGAAIVPGNPKKSLLLRAVQGSDELTMPPGKPLTKQQIAALSEWIQRGAKWPAEKPPPSTITPAEQHWAFQPVQNPALPSVRNSAWVRQPIDRFTLAKLEAATLAPSAEADRRTLIRRLSYDLTGLPPTSADVEAFVRDPSEAGYVKLVDRLLASPHYGEHWGRHWLDVARYSDTKGYVYAREERFWVHAWAYRDWVVRALNQDLPYDRFLLLQLAADQIAPDDPSAQAAMGFLTLGRRFLGVTHDIIDDRIDTVTRGMLGLTVACARCHDHKYDPIPTDDYYSLYGIFRNCVEKVVPASDRHTRTDSAFLQKLETLQKKLDDTMRLRRAEAADRARARAGDYLQAQLELHKYPEEGFDQILSEGDLIPETVRRWRDYLKRAEVDHDPVFAAWHLFAQLPKETFPTEAKRVCRELATASKARVHPLVKKAFAPPPASQLEVAKRYGRLLTQALHSDRARSALLGGTVSVTLSEWTALRDVLFADDSPCVIPDLPIVNIDRFFPSGATTELWKLQGDLDAHLIRSPNAPPYATILVDTDQPINARVLKRGNPATLGAEVPRRFLEALSPSNRTPFTHGSGRLELAKAIASPTNPLTARVIVNRVWMHHFGEGLVRTPSDFGTRAEPPSHPALLDWLAHDFVTHGWSLKRLHRQIVLSATYRQTSTGPNDASIRKEILARDPENRLLWRMNPHRLAFEELRDSLFAVTGSLDERLGGKPGDMLNTTIPARRTIYGLIDRQFPLTVLRVFDAANPDLHTAQRSETTVPQQALFFLNHPLPIARAKALAGHPKVAAASTPEAKVRELYRLVFQRMPTERQLQAALALVRAAENQTRVTPPPPSSAWSYGVAAFDPVKGTLDRFQRLPYYTGHSWQGAAEWPDSSFGWAQLTAKGGHPGNTLQQAVVRRWTAPRDGVVRVSGTLVHEVAAGDGVRATIRSSREGILKSVSVHQSSEAMQLPCVSVMKGDTLDFIVDIKDVLNSDQYLWSPVITELSGSTSTVGTWNSQTEFNGPPRSTLDPWSQLAQALLMTNEFLFVD